MDTRDKLGFWDYLVFGASLVSSLAIGLYYHFRDRMNRTNRAYLLGDKNLSIWPVSMSLMASFMSAITLLGVPAENYMFSTQFVAINISYIIGTPICAYIFLPVFFQLQCTSAYEYLELRFNRPVRIAASSIFMLQMILYMGIVLYAPALALSAVTGLSKWTSIIAVGVVCTLYCTTGGIKAVVWTDLLQSLLMFSAVVCVAIRGTILVGSFDLVIERARNGNRLQFWNLDPDPTIRHSFWTLTIGGVFIYTSLYGVNQTQVQRLLTVRSLKKARTALIISWPITSLLSLVTSFTGLVMYAYFEGCDPLKSKVIERSDQMLPYFMMKVVGDYPGLPGLFVAGIFSGALSSVSSFVNSLAAVALEDYLKPNFASLRDPIKGENKETLIAKLLAFLFGLLCLALTYLAEQMTGILQASLTVFGIVGGPLLGLFTLGMCTRSCSAKSAFISFLASLILGFWIGFGSLSSGLQPIPLQTSIEKCTTSITNLTTQFTSSSNYSTSSSLPFFPSNGIDKRRDKRSWNGEEIESMMVNTITTSTTNNDSRYDDDHNNNGYTSSSNNGNTSHLNSNISSNPVGEEDQQLQPVNLVHHHFSNGEDQKDFKSRTTSPSSSSPLFVPTTQYLTRPALNGQNMKSRDAVQSSHDHHSPPNSNESHLFDHDHISSYIDSLSKQQQARLKKPKGLEVARKQQADIMLADSVGLLNSCEENSAKSIVKMSQGKSTNRNNRRLNREESDSREADVMKTRLRRSSNKQVELASKEVSPVNLGVKGGSYEIKNEGNQNYDDSDSLPSSRFEYSTSEAHNNTQAHT